MPDESLIALLISVAGFAISVGGLVQVYYLSDGGTVKIRILATVLNTTCRTEWHYRVWSISA